jgi:trimethylamine--corrinoid protein Co-methyltransferase
VAAAPSWRATCVPFMATNREQALDDAHETFRLTSATSGPACPRRGFDCADIGSLSLLVFADEVISMVKRIMRGVEVNRQTIMLDLIEKVGPAGYYMAEPESVALCRKEIWAPSLLDRNPFEIWEQKGSKSLEDRVTDKLRKILSTHQPPPLTDSSAEAIQAILSQAEARYF